MVIITALWCQVFRDQRASGRVFDKNLIPRRLTIKQTQKWSNINCIKDSNHLQPHIMHQLQKIIQGALASVTITIFSLTSAAAFAQAGHYFNDNKHVTVDWPHYWPWNDLTANPIHNQHGRSIREAHQYPRLVIRNIRQLKVAALPAALPLRQRIPNLITVLVPVVQ